MGLLIIHIGAGNHSKSKRSQYKRLLVTALNQDGFREASRIIEQSKLTNTGYGSSLDLSGCVECDASFIEVSDKIRTGALVGIDDSMTPITRMLEVYGKVGAIYERWRRFGLTAPILMNYGKWRQMAERNKDPRLRQDDNISGLSQEIYSQEGHGSSNNFTNHAGLVTNDLLILPEAQKIYDTYQGHLFGDSNPYVIPELAHEITDTIGVIEIGSKTTIATSSGGNFFKLPGRIGCAGVVGSAIGFARVNNVEISCMCSGNGEDIMKMELANFLVNAVYDEAEEEYRDYGNFVVTKIKEQSKKYDLSSVNSDGKIIVYLGAIVVINYLKSGRSRIIYCHSTESFYFGYSDGGEPNIVVSSLDNVDRVGMSFACGEFLVLS